MNNELQELKNIMSTTKNTALYKRYQVIYLHLTGFKNVEIADIVSFAPHTVGIQIRKYKSEGLSGLNSKIIPGGPRKLSPEQEALLTETVMNKTPSDVGLKPYMNWDSKLLCEWVNQTFKVSFSQGGMRDMLRRLGFTYTRPTYSLAKADKEKQNKFQETFEELKNFN